MSLRYAGFIPDCHIGDHDETDLNLALDIFQEIKISELILLGDFAEIYSCSRHLKDPSKLGMLLEYEVDMVNSKLDEIDERFPHARKVYLYGNHEARIQSYLKEKCPHLFGLIDLDKLFKINSRHKWISVPYDRNQAYQPFGSDLYCKHKPISSGENHGALTLKKGGVSTIYGHVHQATYVERVRLDGKRIIAHCPGWLGDVKMDTFNYLENPAQWSSGFSYTTHLTNGKWMINHVPVVDHQCLLGTTLYDGRSRD